IYIELYFVSSCLALVEDNRKVVPYSGRGLAVAISGVSYVAPQGCLNAIAGGIVRKEAETRNGTGVITGRLKQHISADCRVSPIRPKCDRDCRGAIEVNRGNDHILLCYRVRRNGVADSSCDPVDAVDQSGGMAISGRI